MEKLKRTSRAIILDNTHTKIYSIRREKIVNSERVIYYTFPGGHVEENETFEETVKREVLEELGINIEIEKEIFGFYNEEIKATEKFFICKYISGILGTGNGEEFTNRNFDKYGSFKIVILEISKLKEYNLLPYEVRDIVQKEFK